MMKPLVCALASAVMMAMMESVPPQQLVAPSVVVGQFSEPRMQRSSPALSRWAPPLRFWRNWPRLPPRRFLLSRDTAPADGTWRLFVADTSSGAVHQLNAWTLRLTTIPEPCGAALLCAALAAAARRRRR